MIIKAIKKILKEKGINEKYADKIQKTFKIEREEDIAEAVQAFEDNILPSIKEAETNAQKSADEAAKKAAIEAYEKEHGLKDGKSIEKQPEMKLDGLDPNVKALIESQNSQIKALTDAVTGMVSAQSKSQKIDLVRAKMQGKIDPEFLEDFVSGVNLESDNLDAEVQSQIEKYTKLQQKFITKAVKDGDYEPVSGGVSDSDFGDFLKSKSETAPAFEGAKI